MRHFSAAQLAEHLQQHTPLLLDVREPWEFNTCHIPQSELVPMAQIPARMQDFDSEREIVLICHHGIRSRQVGMYLEANGFSNLINLSGGIDAWAQQVDRDMPIY